MTRKDYEAIERAIKRALDGATYGNAARWDGIKSTAESIAVELVHDNEWFDRERFMRACGFED